jgi:hypothetical protein
MIGRRNTEPQHTGAERPFAYDFFNRQLEELESRLSASTSTIIPLLIANQSGSPALVLLAPSRKWNLFRPTAPASFLIATKSRFSGIHFAPIFARLLVGQGPVVSAAEPSCPILLTRAPPPGSQAAASDRRRGSRVAGHEFPVRTTNRDPGVPLPHLDDAGTRPFCPPMIFLIDTTTY